MKDYKLSDAKAICEQANYDCEHCEFGDYQWLGNFWGCLLQNNPRNWTIDEENTSIYNFHKAVDDIFYNFTIKPKTTPPYAIEQENKFETLKKDPLSEV